MLGGPNTVSRELASVYWSNNAKLAQILKKIASGKKIDRPSDDLAGFNRAQAISGEIDRYQTVKQNLTAATAVSGVAADAGNAVYTDVSRMRTLVGLWWDAQASGDADAQTQYAAEFNALKATVQDYIDNTSYDGQDLISDAFSYAVDTDPDGNGSITISFDADDIIDVSSLTIGDTSSETDLARIDPQMSRATHYVRKAEAFDKMLNRQVNMTETILQGKESVVALITEIDEVEEIANATRMGIRQQATVAMLAQANLLQAAVARLYGDAPGIAFGGPK